jgi:hypothetical protein
MVDWDAMLANVKLDDTDDAPKITCEDCIHHNVCGYHITDETDLTVEECTHFKNKANFVEVVRCRECKHADIIGNTLYCFYWDRNTDEEGFCHEGV